MNVKRAWCVVSGAWVFAALTTPPAPAQIRKSQRGTVSQTIATTTVTIVYNRPTARGRELFGALVPWSKAWTPGADEATTLTASKDIVVAGQSLPAGKYSVWAIPEPGEWTLIFNRKADAWHTSYPSGQDQLRIKVQAERAGQFLETLTFSFPMVDADSATLALQWGETLVRMPLKAPTTGVPTR